jgi:hypothetical protein
VLVELACHQQSLEARSHVLVEVALVVTTHLVVLVVRVVVELVAQTQLQHLELRILVVVVEHLVQALAAISLVAQVAQV